MLLAVLELEQPGRVVRLANVDAILQPRSKRDQPDGRARRGPSVIYRISDQPMGELYDLGKVRRVPSLSVSHTPGRR